MHGFVILLVVIGCIFLLLLALGSISDTESAPPPEDPAAPYREGLYAAIRMQRVAQDLEQQIYDEAARQMEREPPPEQAS